MKPTISDFVGGSKSPCRQANCVCGTPTNRLPRSYTPNTTFSFSPRYSANMRRTASAATAALRTTVVSSSAS